jgi:hypothetical protein
MDRAPTEFLAKCQDWGVWEPASVGRLGREKLDAVTQECLRVAQAFPGGESSGTITPSDRVLASKLPYLLEARLRASGQLKPADQNEEWLESTVQDLVPTMLAICTRTIAEDMNWAWDIVDDKNVTQTLRASALTDGGGGLEAQDGVMMKVSGLLQPKSGVALGDLITFRREHHKEFGRYMDALAATEEEAKRPSRYGVDGVAEVLGARVKELSKVAAYRNIGLGRRTKYFVQRADPTMLAMAGGQALTSGWDYMEDGELGLMSLAPAAIGLVVKGVQLRIEVNATAYLKKAHANGLLNPSR